jgi:hypothetical protein
LSKQFDQKRVNLKRRQSALIEGDELKKKINVCFNLPNNPEKKKEHEKE